MLLIFITFLLIPKVHIDIKGERNIFLEVGSEYKDAGASAYISTIFGKRDLKLEIDSIVNTNKIGKYQIIYTTKYNKKTYQSFRNIIIKDTIKPEIIIDGKIEACKNSKAIQMKIKAIDNYDGDISDKINYKIDGDKIEIFSVDSSGNENALTKELYYIDNEKPKIELKGQNKISLNLGDNYEELGVSAYDSCDGNLTSKIKIEGQVDTNVSGIYKLTYTVKDSSNNSSSITREIEVKEKIEQKDKNIIYLTFDDGPGQYTEELLNVLKTYDVKATFFVTNQFPKFQYLIKQEYENGHTVGIHTYSHKWNIYSSVEAYLNDFNSIEQIVYEQTGQHPKLFRFPGGSSNTVSKNYSKGIMTNLSKIMTEKGYIYFDWTFDSGDTSKKNNSKEAILKNVKTYLNNPKDYIILMHDIKKNTLEALPEIITYAKEKGYIFKALDENVQAPHFKIAN